MGEILFMFYVTTLRKPFQGFVQVNHPSSSTPRTVPTYRSRWTNPKFRRLVILGTPVVVALVLLALPIKAIAG